MEISTLDMSRRQARERPDAVAWVAPDRDWTFGVVERLTNRLANAMRSLGIGRGDRLAILTKHQPECAMLIQADRFGTSISESLRVLSDMLRTRRRMRAEERAAKIALKLLFPLIFCIFPALMMVLLGPAMIHVYRVLLPTFIGVAP